MATKPKYPYGPNRKELWIWLIVAISGLALLAFAAWYRDMVQGLVGLELLVFGTAFFGYLMSRSVNRLFINPEEDVE